MKTMQLSVLKRIDALLARAAARASVAPPSNLASSGAGAGVVPGDLSGTTTAPGVVVAALDLTPQTSGIILVNFKLTYVLSAADSVSLILQTVPAVTGISGGAAVGAFHYETTGSPLAITGGAPVTSQIYAMQIPAGAITSQSATLSGLIFLLPTKTRQAIQLVAATAGGAHLTGLLLNGSGIEQAAP